MVKFYRFLSHDLSESCKKKKHTISSKTTSWRILYLATVYINHQVNYFLHVWDPRSRFWDEALIFWWFLPWHLKVFRFIRMQVDITRAIGMQGFKLLSMENVKHKVVVSIVYVGKLSWSNTIISSSQVPTFCYSENQYFL